MIRAIDARAERVQVYLRLCPSLSLTSCVTIDDTSNTTTSLPSSSTIVGAGNTSITLNRGESNSPIRYSVDGAFDAETSQEDVFNAVGVPAVSDVLNGYNASIICYGQTGTGKTYTMTGANNINDALRLTSTSGLLPRALTRIFSALPPPPTPLSSSNSSNSLTTTTTTATTPTSSWDAHVSYVQVYREEVYDLLAEWAGFAPRALSLREDPITGVFVEGLTWHSVNNATDALALVAAGNASRATAATLLNAHSSRSHAIFFLRVARRSPSHSTNATNTNTPQTSLSLLVGTLALVDLAGSERVAKSGATGARLDEAASINLSLSALGNCVVALGVRASTAATAAGAATGLASVAAAGAAAGAAAVAASLRAAHVPFRDSKLTRLLSSFLGGGARTALVITASTDPLMSNETTCTLEFGARASRVRVAAAPNLAKDYKTLCASLQRQLALLRSTTNGTTTNNIDDNIANTTLSTENDDATIINTLRAELSIMKGRIAELDTQVAALSIREKSAITAFNALEASAAIAAKNATGSEGTSDGVPSAVRALFNSSNKTTSRATSEIVVFEGTVGSGGSGNSLKTDALADIWAREVAGIRLGITRAASAAISMSTKAAEEESARANAALAALAAARSDALDALKVSRNAALVAASVASEADSRRAALLDELANSRRETESALMRARVSEASAERLREKLRVALLKEGSNVIGSGSGNGGVGGDTTATTIAALYEESLEGLARRVASLEAAAEAHDAALADALARRRAGHMDISLEPVALRGSGVVAKNASSLKITTHSQGVNAVASGVGNTAIIPPRARSSDSQSAMLLAAPITLGASAASRMAANAARFGITTPARQRQ